MSEEKYVVVATKVRKECAELLKRLAKSKGMSLYELSQLVYDFLVRFMSDEHNMTPEMQRLMQMFHSIEWKNTFTHVDPTARAEVCEEVLILSAPNKKGFRAVKVTKPWCGNMIQTENVNTIVERVIEVCLPEVYRRLRMMCANMGCASIGDLLVTLADADQLEELNTAIRKEFEDNRRDSQGNTVQYGRRTKKTFMVDTDNPKLFDNE
jgi:hypothetical protein